MRSELPYCVFPRWPQDDDAWIHPDDVPAVRRLIPGTRVFRRGGQEGQYFVLRYGKLRLRIHSAMHVALSGDGLNVGDLVEVCSQVGKNRPMMAMIAEMHWSARYGAIEYRLRRRAMTLARRYTAGDLRLVTRRLVV